MIFTVWIFFIVALLGLIRFVVAWFSITSRNAQKPAHLQFRIATSEYIAGLICFIVAAVFAGVLFG